MLSDDDNSSDVAVANKKTATKNGAKKDQKRKNTAEEESSGEDNNLLKKKTKPAKEVEVKKATKKSKVDSDSEDLSPPKGKVQQKAKPSKTEDSDDDIEIVGTKNKKQQAKPVKKTSMVDSDEVKKILTLKLLINRTKNQLKEKKLPLIIIIKRYDKYCLTFQKNKFSDDEDEEDEAPKKNVKKSPATKPKKPVVTPDSDVEEEEEVEVKTNNGKKPTPQATEGEGHNELFVKNLSYQSNDDGLFNFFSNYGTVTNCRILTHKDTGKSKGIGFVEFSTNEEAKAALDDVANLNFDGRYLFILKLDNQKLIILDKKEEILEALEEIKEEITGEEKKILEEDKIDREEIAGEVKKILEELQIILEIDIPLSLETYLLKLTKITLRNFSVTVETQLKLELPRTEIPVK